MEAFLETANLYQERSGPDLEAFKAAAEPNQKNNKETCQRIEKIPIGR